MKKPRQLAILRRNFKRDRLKLTVGQMVVYKKVSGGYKVRPARVLRDELGAWGTDKAILLSERDLNFELVTV